MQKLGLFFRQRSRLEFDRNARKDSCSQLHIDHTFDSEAYSRSKLPSFQKYVPRSTPVHLSLDDEQTCISAHAMLPSYEVIMLPTQSTLIIQRYFTYFYFRNIRKVIRREKNVIF